MLDVSQFYAHEGEKPLDVILPDGGFTAIFRRIGCVGDSLSSGEFEFLNPDGTKRYRDMYEHSWGQYLGRMTGSKVYNFSRGGMHSKDFMESFGEFSGCFDRNNVCDAYILALGVNDLLGKHLELGSISDIHLDDPKKNEKTFAGYYAQIIQNLKEIQPKAKFFLMTMVRQECDKSDVNDPIIVEHAKLLREMADLFDNTYVIDLEQNVYYDKTFNEFFYLGGHMNPMGYLFTAKIVGTYIDYIIRNNPQDFKEVGFIDDNCCK